MRLCTDSSSSRKLYNSRYVKKKTVLLLNKWKWKSARLWLIDDVRERANHKNSHYYYYYYYHHYFYYYRGRNITATPKTTQLAPWSSPPLVWVSLLVLLLPLVLFLKVLYRYVHLCPCLRDKKTLHTDTGQDCRPGPTTLVCTLLFPDNNLSVFVSWRNFTITEETPIADGMCPVTPDSPAHCALLLPEVKAVPDQNIPESFPAIVLYAVIKEVPLRRWKELMRLLSVADQQLERVELDMGLNSLERQYQQLRLWSQKPSAKMDDIYSALHYMELVGCAQMITESLTSWGTFENARRRCEKLAEDIQFSVEDLILLNF
ncbi:hypothetical protein WMY93_021998 [Mugilogobius chulae]|uniref:Death domain-containing protein n=1 Tax=Mugilogobius chulae TaxID=88201 RepID=A0AAW0NPE4_9GOBI